MPTYTVLADADEAQFQNPQELVSIWGGIREDIDRLGGELEDSYALVGGHDFMLTFEVDEEDAALQIALAIEGRGLDTETLRSIPIDRMGDLVEDV
ncbi:GYD domain-containing protein [Halobaculum sp. CBA1158]|uniref:GYD domain-containing protein n=1 Tax=Halobaculum sp. CBA1158 TaxID=2904243 RepID=UPI001F2808C8|nr:GYD domain-containing protein [Halobaculum sp. CBA1158]UIO98472.1 GYD domain-containing protein [Halobaculum sp. CBA1158]